jgi:CMP-N,N'-diacetyllegionaminic acid synthase
MNNSLKTLGIIPARAGSKGVPGKNMKLLGGCPLISYTIKSAQKSSLLDKIIVSSDCEKTIAYARQFTGVEVPFKRPAHFARDESPSIDLVKHALDYYIRQGFTFEYVVLLQPTSPFRSSDLIDRAISYMMESDADSLVTVQKIPDQFNPYWAMQMRDGPYIEFMDLGSSLAGRRQDLPETYYRDGKVYISKVSLVRKGLLVGGKIAGLITADEPDVNIDTIEDWQLAQQELAKYGDRS